MSAATYCPDHIRDFLAAVQAATGGSPDKAIEPGKFSRFSTNGKRNNTDGWCLLFDDGKGGAYGCWRQGIHATWHAPQVPTHVGHATCPSAAHGAQIAAILMDRFNAHTRAKTQQSEWQAAGFHHRELWAASEPIAPDGSGTDPVTLYLRRRLARAPGEVLAIPTVIRCHPGLKYYADGVLADSWPAMVAAVQDPAGDVVALHRTWLTHDGQKAPVPGPVKKLSRAAGHVMGGCVRLAWPQAGDARVVGVAEGIETAMAANLLFGVPTVAAYCAGALEAWQWPPGVHTLVVFADADDAGARAAQGLKARAEQAGLMVSVMVPSNLGWDWCDVRAQYGSLGVSG